MLTDYLFFEVRLTVTTLRPVGEPNGDGVGLLSALGASPENTVVELLLVVCCSPENTVGVELLPSVEVLLALD